LRLSHGILALQSFLIGLPICMCFIKWELMKVLSPKVLFSICPSWKNHGYYLVFLLL